MIWHFFEVWLLLLATFTVGCLLGTVLYRGVAATPAAEWQGIAADAVGDVVDAVKARFGIGPSWRTGHVRAHERVPVPEPAAFAPPPVAGERPRFARTFARPILDEPAVEPATREEERQAEWQAEREEDWSDQREEDWLPEREEDWPDDATFYDDAADSEAADFVEGRAPRPQPEAPAAVPGLPAMKPVGIAAPRNGVADDLQRIRGIGRRNEELLNSLGIFHFSQIAAWTPAEVRWVAAYLAFPERIDRDDWIGQATVLGSGGDTGYVKAASRRRDDPGPEAEA